MKIYREGDRDTTICYRCEKRVTTCFERRTVHLDESDVNVEAVLVGVCEECGETATIPAQSTPRLKEAREDKNQVLQAHVPRHLDDLLYMIADRLDAQHREFTPAMLRFYLNELARSDRFAKRVKRLADSDLVRSPSTVRRSLRMHQDLLDAAWSSARRAGIQTKTDMVRGVIAAASEDLLDESSARARRRKVEALAAAS